MLFNSLSFLVLFIVTFVVYYLPISTRYQVFILIVSSLFFYAYHKPTLLLLLLISAGINIIVSHYIVYGNKQHQKLLATVGVGLNLFILIFFKYAGLLSSTLNFSGSVGDFLLTIPLPIGISFYTFEGISLLVDLYKGDVKDKTHIPPSLSKHGANTLLFISFFPHLIAGPILKAHQFLPQIKVKLLRDIPWESAFRSITLGYFLKMVVADNLKNYTFWIEYPYFNAMPSSSLIMMLFGFSFQLFADFAGYSLIAIGTAKLLGYHLPDNFNFPYVAQSFQDFWRRWHISLSTFLKEYLYFPLGGSRKGQIRTLLNLMIVMFLGGLWHGAAWSYAIWGLFHGLMQVFERLAMSTIKIKTNVVIVIIQRISVFLLVSLSWLLFKLPELNYVIEYIQSMYSNTFPATYAQRLEILRIIMYSSPVIVYHLFYLVRDNKYFQIAKRFDYLVYGAMLFLILTNSGKAQAFIYFQF